MAKTPESPKYNAFGQSLGHNAVIRPEGRGLSTQGFSKAAIAGKWIGGKGVKYFMVYGPWRAVSRE